MLQQAAVSALQHVLPCITRAHEPDRKMTRNVSDFQHMYSMRQQVACNELSTMTFLGVWSNCTYTISGFSLPAFQPDCKYTVSRLRFLPTYKATQADLAEDTPTAPTAYHYGQQYIQSG